MRSPGLRRVAAPAEFRLGGRTVPALLYAVGARRVWLCLREADAIAGRDLSAEGGEIAVRPRGAAADDGWIRGADLRPGPARGASFEAVRMAALTPFGDADPTSRWAVDAMPPVRLFVDDEAPLPGLRSNPALAGVEVRSVAEAPGSEALGALLLGCRPPHDPDEAAVRALLDRHPGLSAVLCARSGATTGWRGDLAGSGAVHYACSGWPRPAELAALLHSALECAAFHRAWRLLFGGADGDGAEGPEWAWYDSDSRTQRRSVQRTLRDLEVRVEERLPGVTANLYAYDEWAESLVGSRPTQEGHSVESAAVGAISFVARTGVSLREDRPERSVFFDPDLDAAPGAGSALFALPVRDHSGSVFGVLAGHPDEPGGSFAPEAPAEARLVASEFAPAFAGLREVRRPEIGKQSIFRPEALAEHRRPESTSSILNVSARWGGWIVGGLAALVVGFFAFLFFGRSTEYAEGAALVRSRGQVPVVANAPGTVAEVRLSPGAAVSPGTVVGTLYDADELALAERLEQEYEAQLVSLLRFPDDPTLGSSLPSLRAGSREARSALRERALRSPTSGILTDVRVRVGTAVTPGQTVATVGTPGAGFELVAEVPGNYRPLLREGLPVVAELAQFPGDRLHLIASAVSPEVVDAAEAEAILGRGFAEEVGTGSVALVYARVPEEMAEAFGDGQGLYDGMTGAVRIPVRRDRFIASLWPSLGSSTRR